MKAYLLLFLFFSQFVFAQTESEKPSASNSVGLQYAGSIGWLSGGYFRQSANKKTEAGLLYGYTPEFVGGEIHTLSLKFIYEPFRINVKRDFQIEPLQTGIFIAQSFAKNLYLTWPDKYVPGYYWWNPSTRLHIFYSIQASYLVNKGAIQKISFYAEANTNDLYLFSYFGRENRKSLAFYDIIFLGLGTKLYFK